MTKKMYANKTGNKIKKAFNQITPKSGTSRTSIPKLQASNVGNQGDSAPVGKVRKGLF